MHCWVQCGDVYQGFDMRDQSAFSRKFMALSSADKVHRNPRFALGSLLRSKPWQDRLPVEWVTDWDSMPVLFCISVGKTQGSEAAGPPKKKRKRAQKKSREREEKVVEPKAQALGEKSRATSRARKPAAEEDEKASGPSRAPAGEELGGKSITALRSLKGCCESGVVGGPRAAEGEEMGDGLL